MAVDTTTMTTEIIRSGNGRMVNTKTVVRAIHNLGKVYGHKVMSVEDITGLINASARGNGSVTERQVEKIMADVAAACANGMQYYDLSRSVLNLGCGFFQYGR